MAKKSVELELSLAERYVESSWDTSEALGFMALRSAVNELIKAVRILSQEDA